MSLDVTRSSLCGVDSGFAAAERGSTVQKSNRTGAGHDVIVMTGPCVSGIVSSFPAVRSFREAIYRPLGRVVIHHVLLACAHARGAAHGQGPADQQHAHEHQRAGHQIGEQLGPDKDGERRHDKGDAGNKDQPPRAARPLRGAAAEAYECRWPVGKHWSISMHTFGEARSFPEGTLP